MKYFIYLWLLPMAIFWGWYGLSAHDMSMGIFFLTRELHDKVFNIYSQILHIPAEDIPWMAAKACIFDSFIVLGLMALRYRKKWLPVVADAVSSRSAIFKKH